MAWRRRLAASLTRAATAGRGPVAAAAGGGAALAALPPARGVSSWTLASPSRFLKAAPTAGGTAGAAGVAALAAHGAVGSPHAPIGRRARSSAAAPPPSPLSISHPTPSTLLLTLHRPAALNALNEATMHALVSAASDADSDPAIRAIIITGGDCGAGRAPAFAAGADVRELAAHSYASSCSTRLLDGWRALRHVRVPIIAAVEGFALGGGCELAAACDLVVAGAGASFGQPEVGLGVVPGMGATQRLPRAVGKAVAMDLILTGRRLTAQEALAAGLVSRVVPAGRALEEAASIAAAIGRAPRAAVAKAKELTNAAFEMPLAAGLETELREFWACFGTADQVEGMGAFLEKRAPRF